MKQKLLGKLLLLVLLFSFFDTLGMHFIKELSTLNRLQPDTVFSAGFRAGMLNEQVLKRMERTDGKDNGMLAGLYLLETNGGARNISGDISDGTWQKWQKKWSAAPAWGEYHNYCDAIWQELKYFPVPVSTKNKRLTVSFVDSWMGERSYGGKRGHEGTDIMASENKTGLYPVISMTDGEVTAKGWLEKGGYRIGITAPGGGYFYYAHLDSYADLKVGDQVKAGDVLGFMGDTGYGPEGTTGKFDVHLHVGIYIYPDGEEISVNPYWILKYLEKHQLKCAYS